MGWFTLPMELVEVREDFKQLTPMAKLYFLFLMSEFNWRGSFGLSDLKASVALRVSTRTIQRARGELVKMGLIEVITGFQTRRGQNIATQYLKVKYAKHLKGHFAQIKHYALQAMLHKLRQGIFDHGDLVVYFYLYYWNWKHRGSHKGVVIYKNYLSGLTNIKDAPLRVKKLYDNFIFSDNNHLFEYRDLYQKLIFTDWAFFTDPEEDENTRKRMDYYNNEIKEMVREKKEFKEMQKPPISLQAKRLRQ
jgi:hypothetical protein